MKRKAVVDLSETETPATTPEEPLETSKDDQGHRLGNFHNYYAFHPPSLRLDKMKDILEYIAAHNDSTTFQYCDLGCNQGDLTVAVADALEQALKKPIVYTGIDIDPVLIERANTNHKGDFRVANILQKHDLQVIPDQNLISLFSVTMWLHVNSGDGGFREALLNICERCKPQGSFLLIEPQPSKCYRKAMTRLRKMGRPEFDASCDNLKLRPKIEEEIDTILQSVGFRRVLFPSSTKTEWNRSLELYERK